jgi:hypothetical protein
MNVYLIKKYADFTYIHMQVPYTTCMKGLIYASIFFFYKRKFNHIEHCTQIFSKVENKTDNHQQ